MGVGFIAALDMSLSRAKRGNPISTRMIQGECQARMDARKYFAMHLKKA